MKTQDLSPDFIMLIGAPASGKSTWTKNFLAGNDRHYVILSTDDLVTQMAADIGLNYTQGFQKFIGPATKQFNADFSAAIRAGENIIMDRTNMSAQARAKFLDRLPPQYRKIAVTFQVDRAELDRRLAARAELEGKEIPDHVVNNMLANYDPPTNREFDVIKKGN